MSYLDDLLTSHGVKLSAPSEGEAEDTAAVLVTAALSALAELSEELELAFPPKKGDDDGKGKKLPFGDKKKPPFGKGKNNDSDDDDDRDDDEDDGPPWAKKKGSGKGGNNESSGDDKKKPPFGKGNKAKCTALLDAATVALSGLETTPVNWVELTAQDNRMLALSGSKPYGNVTYADPGHQKDGKSRYPVDTPEHVRAAWSYVNQKENGDKYTPEDLAQVKSKIKLAMRKHGIKGGDDKES